MHLHVHLIIFITNRKERKKFIPKFTLDILFNVVVLRMVIQFYNFYNLLNQDALVSTLSSCTKNEVFHSKIKNLMINSREAAVTNNKYLAKLQPVSRRLRLSSSLMTLFEILILTVAFSKSDSEPKQF